VKGEAAVPLKVGPQDTRGVVVARDGYESQHVDADGRWPLRVTLRPTTAP
jgi:hypothetical protein